MSLDIGLLISGAKERGELESRVTNILSECKDAGNVILMCARPRRSLPCCVQVRVVLSFPYWNYGFGLVGLGFMAHIACGTGEHERCHSQALVGMRTDLTVDARSFWNARTLLHPTSVWRPQAGTRFITSDLCRTGWMRFTCWSGPGP